MKKLLLIIGTFYILFYPHLFVFHSLRIMAAISLIYLFIRMPGWNVIFNTNRIKVVYITWIFVLIWISMIILLNGTSLGSVNSYVYWLLSVIPCSLMIGNEVRRNGGDVKELIDIALYAGLLQGICSVLAFFVPAVKNFFLTQMASAEILDLSHYGYYVNMRLYGFSNGLTYAMPVLQAFLAMLAIYMTINRNIKYLLFVPFTLFSAIVNARTSLVIIAICGIVLLLQKSNHSSQKTGRVMMLIAIGLITLYGGVRILQIYAPNTFLWIADGAGQIELFFRGQFDRGYFSYLLDADRWKFPSGIAFFFGEGLRILGENSTGNYTDVGYVNDVWLGGLSYTIFIYAIVISYLRKLAKSGKENEKEASLVKYIAVSLLLSGILLNLKGYVVNLNCIANFFIFIACFQSLTLPRQINNNA